MKRHRLAVFILGLTFIISMFVLVFGVTRTWTGKLSEVNLDYDGRNGGAQITVQGDNYSYSFAMVSHGAFSGSVTADSLSVSNVSHYSGGGATESIGRVGQTTTHTMSVGQEASLHETLKTNGDSGDITVKVVVYGDEAHLRRQKPRMPTARPQPILHREYVKNSQGQVIGGSFKNIGTATFKGFVKFTVGLSYNIGWTAEGVTTYMSGKSPVTITIKPKKKVVFFWTPNPAGGFTCYFPDVLYHGKPLSFSIMAPQPNSPAAVTFKKMIYETWTGYKDPEPNVDYVNPVVELVGKKTKEKIEFYFPIHPFFAPPR